VELKNKKIEEKLYNKDKYLDKKQSLTPKLDSAFFDVFFEVYRFMEN
jgi:hypothetical protein